MSDISLDFLNWKFAELDRLL